MDAVMDTECAAAAGKKRPVEEADAPSAVDSGQATEEPCAKKPKLSKKEMLEQAKARLKEAQEKKKQLQQKLEEEKKREAEVQEQQSFEYDEYAYSEDYYYEYHIPPVTGPRDNLLISDIASTGPTDKVTFIQDTKSCIEDVLKVINGRKRSLSPVNAASPWIQAQAQAQAANPQGPPVGPPAAAQALSQPQETMVKTSSSGSNRSANLENFIHHKMPPRHPNNPRNGSNTSGEHHPHGPPPQHRMNNPNLNHPNRDWDNNRDRGGDRDREKRPRDWDRGDRDWGSRDRDKGDWGMQGRGEPPRRDMPRRDPIKDKPRRDATNNPPPQTRRDVSSTGPPQQQRRELPNGPLSQRRDSATGPPQQQRRELPNGPLSQRRDSATGPPQQQRRELPNGPLSQRRDSAAIPPQQQRRELPNGPLSQRRDSAAIPPQQHRRELPNGPLSQRRDGTAGPPQQQRRELPNGPLSQRRDGAAGPPQRRESAAKPPTQRRDSAAAPPPQQQRRDSATAAAQQRRDSAKAPAQQRRDSAPPKKPPARPWKLALAQITSKTLDCTLDLPTKTHYMIRTQDQGVAAYVQFFSVPDNPTLLQHKPSKRHLQDHLQAVQKLPSNSSHAWKAQDILSFLQHQDERRTTYQPPARRNLPLSHWALLDLESPLHQPPDSLGYFTAIPKTADKNNNAANANSDSKDSNKKKQELSFAGKLVWNMNDFYHNQDSGMRQRNVSKLSKWGEVVSAKPTTGIRNSPMIATVQGFYEIPATAPGAKPPSMPPALRARKVILSKSRTIGIIIGVNHKLVEAAAQDKNNSNNTQQTMGCVQVLFPNGMASGPSSVQSLKGARAILYD